RRLWTPVKHVLGECCAGFLEQRYDAIAMPLCVLQHEFPGAPPNVAEFQLTQLSVTQSSGCQQQHDRPIAYVGGCLGPDGGDRASDVLPRHTRWQVRLTPAWSPRHELRQVPRVEVLPVEVA